MATAPTSATGFTSRITPAPCSPFSTRGGLGRKIQCRRPQRAPQHRHRQAICEILDEIAPQPTARREDLITFVTDRPGHDHRYAIDASKLETELGWRAQETFDTGIDKTVAWYLENEWWWRPLRDKVYAGERLGLMAEKETAA